MAEGWKKKKSLQYSLTVHLGWMRTWMSINPDNSIRELNSSPNYYERAISFPPTILSNILLFAHIRVTHMAFQVSRIGRKK